MPDVRDTTVTLLEVAPSAYASITSLAAAAADGRETGGVLLGHDPGEGTVQVRRAGDPGPAAVRRPDRFVRDLDHARRLAQLAYAADGGIWVGEWHTHPATQMAPSPTDLTAYREVLAAGAGLPRFVAVIVTASPDHGWRKPILAPWLIVRDSVHPMTLSITAVAAVTLPEPGHPFLTSVLQVGGVSDS